MRVAVQFDLLQTDAIIPTYLSGTECDSDYLEIYDGNSTRRLCGDWRPKLRKLNFRSVGHVIILKFVSDHTRSGLGFLMRWITVRENASEIPCPTGWEEGYSDSCYRVVHQQNAWEDAQQQCEEMNSHLAIIENLEEEAFIDQIINDR